MSDFMVGGFGLAFDFGGGRRGLGFLNERCFAHDDLCGGEAVTHACVIHCHRKAGLDRLDGNGKAILIDVGGRFAVTVGERGG